MRTPHESLLVARVVKDVIWAIRPLEWSNRPAAARVWTDWVNQDRSARVWGAIRAVANGAGSAPALAHAVTACAEVLSAMGAGFAMTRDGSALEPLLASAPAAAELDELQFTLGEGPSVDSITSGAPALEADLAAPGAGRRWPAFAPAGAERGARAAFAFPVGVGAAKVGVLSVYREQAGELDGDQVRDALVFADALLVLALDHRRGVSADLDEVIDAAFASRRAEVHQAAGLIAAQQDISVTDALARLRAHAYLSGLPLHRIAADVMAGRLRLESDRGSPPPTGTHDPKDRGSRDADTKQEDDG